MEAQSALEYSHAQLDLLKHPPQEPVSAARRRGVAWLPNAFREFVGPMLPTRPARHLDSLASRFIHYGALVRCAALVWIDPDMVITPWCSTFEEAQGPALCCEHVAASKACTHTQSNEATAGQIWARVHSTLSWKAGSLSQCSGFCPDTRRAGVVADLSREWRCATVRGTCLVAERPHCLHGPRAAARSTATPPAAGCGSQKRWPNAFRESVWPMLT